MTANTLQMAVKGKEPVVSIQVPSDRPIFIRRKVLKTAIAGMVIQTVELHKDEHSGHRYIRVRGIDGKSPRIRRYYAFRDMDATQAHRLMERYKPAPKMTRDERKAERIQQEIKKLQREASKIRCNHAPQNPLLEEPSDALREYYRDEILNWYQQKPQRKALARVVGKWIESGVWRRGWREVYTALQNADFRIEDRNKFARIGKLKRGPSTETYLKDIYLYVVGNMERTNYCSEYTPDMSKMMQEHRNNRIEYLNDVHTLRNVMDQIAVLKEMLP